LFATERKSWWGWLAIAPAGLLYAATLAVPLMLILLYSTSTVRNGVPDFAFQFANYKAALTDGITLAILRRTTLLSVAVTFGCAALAYPIALEMRRAGPTARLVILALIVAPLLTSVIIRNVAWLLILGRNGIVNSTLKSLGIIEQPLPLMYNNFGVIIAVVHVYLAFAVLPIYAALDRIDKRIEESASSLGASDFEVFWRVTFPLSLPGLMAGCSLVFILSMGLYLTPAIMGGSFVVTIAMVITDLARNQYNWPMAAAVSVLLLATIAAVLSARLFWRGRSAT
jgi:putative spermidine/putrescine transport system permease protein